MNVPAVSVVIPCHNGASFLEQAIKSALGQTYPPLEIIVIDDGSTDNSRAIALSFGTPVVVLSQSNQGESVARNRGMDEAKGDWIAFLDADDVWEPNKLAEQMRVIEPNVTLVATGARLFRETKSLTTECLSKVEVPLVERFSRSWIIEHGGVCHMSSVLVQKSTKARFPTWTRHGEDLVFYLDMLDSGKVAVVKEALIGYRLSQENQSNHPLMNRWRRDSYRKWLDSMRESLPPSEWSELDQCWQRGMKREVLAEALRYRQAGRPLSGLVLYAKILFSSLVSPSSPSILKISIRGGLVSIAECLKIKQCPVIPEI